ncbi:tRNA methyltransferase ppm2, variant 3 [Purpureocillium takamizusanense]|uniref:tRNA wybutosine-synthesizing protein 4 n=1 Tax=Purpureocillium takamizusanense TaxID=2060973 RepID=A0A9Q8QC46_9HYPO|nr:tRNA methyltransferase ppm2, variant 3 [Purpureocillium takamizusanense]UNI16231.1 tRNA methyltransferase ppm2, variant 3 [Purpureocillium takamizusanense]
MTSTSALGLRLPGRNIDSTPRSPFHPPTPREAVRMSPATPSPSRSQALDDMIMGTNSSSIVSKRSVERLYYPDETHFFRYFVKKFQRRAPLINRGYWLRLRAIDVVVRQFLTRPSERKKLVINLGCGSDVLPWQCHARHGSACDRVLFIDIDYPDLMYKKRAVVLETPELKELLGQEYIIGESDILLRSERYCQIGCDLRQLQKLRTTLESFLSLDDCEVLFVAEVSITYMDTTSADLLLQWASIVGKAEFCLLEQILPHGPDHPFAKTMLIHFDKLKTPPRSVRQYPTLDSQRNRFLDRGWADVAIWDLWQVWSDDYFVNGEERSALDQVEPFDEWEEFILFSRHYFIVHAVAPGVVVVDRGGSLATGGAAPSRTPNFERLDVAVTTHSNSAPRRRYGEAFLVSDSRGRKSLLHMGGLGSSGRSDSWDIYSLSGHSEPPRLPLRGPPSRMCFTMTDLGDFGILLAGGRTSPGNALSDCWLYQKGAKPSWQMTWRLPAPLYRHSAIRLKGTSLALVLGGKTGASTLSSECYVFCLERGWLRCHVQGADRCAAFGAVVYGDASVETKEGVFSGVVAGGIREDGCICTKEYSWRLSVLEERPTIEFKVLSDSQQLGGALALFGAKCVDLGPDWLLCGGLGHEASFLGRDLVLISRDIDGKRIAKVHGAKNESMAWPFMIGCGAVTTSTRVLLVGGGATCFSMGTFWDAGVYSIDILGALSGEKPRTRGNPAVQHTETRRIVSTAGATSPADAHGEELTITQVPRIRLGTGAITFDDILSDAKPVILEGLTVGTCVEKWTPRYMVEQVGDDTEVVVHECHRDLQKMDFNSKNFDYVRDSFGKIVSKMQAGARMYLRSLSRDKPSAAPAILENDFPRLAIDFCLPPELAHIGKNLFSSVLRMSGMVTMWLHYDVGTTQGDAVLETVMNRKR